MLLEGEVYSSIATNKYKNNNFVPILYYFVPRYDIIGSMLMPVRVCNLTVGDKLIIIKRYMEVYSCEKAECIKSDKVSR